MPAFKFPVAQYDNSKPPTNMTFGKHKGTPICLVAAKDPDYLRWVLKNLLTLNAPTRTAIQLALMSVEN